MSYNYVNYSFSIEKKSNMKKKIGIFFLSSKQNTYILQLHTGLRCSTHDSTELVERCLFPTFSVERCPFSTFWVERCPFSTLFDFTGHCLFSTPFSTLPDIVRLFSTLLDFVRLCWTLFDFVRLCSTLPDIVRLYRELAEESWTITTLGHHWTVSVKSPFKNLNLVSHKIK